MKKAILVVAVMTVIMTGCAQKKINTIDANAADINGIASGTNGTDLYANVDPMGQGNASHGQQNIIYGQERATYGQENGIYGDAGVQSIYFNLDEYSITSAKLGQISHNANLLRNSGKVKIEGHCDASGSDEYNYALGLRRAKATKDALSANGISSNKITLVSMGESAPECSMNAGADCYAKNRRVEFKVMQ